MPLIVRGPSVKKGHRDTLSSYGMVDLSRTILDIAGARPDYDDDGVHINLHQQYAADPSHQLARHSISEYWVLAVDEGVYGGHLRTNNTYRTLRVHDETHGTPTTYSYSVWCTGERELYDLVADPHQVNNLLAGLNSVGPFAPFNASIESKGAPLSPHLQRTLHRLDGLLLVLKTCIGAACHKPYSELIPSSFATGSEEVFRLSQALNERYDDFFANLPRVRFDECALGFQSRLEKPEWNSAWAFGAEKKSTQGHFVLQGY